MRTIKLPCEGLFKEKGSKFYAYAFPLETAFQLKDFLEIVKENHPKARHFCYALLLKEGEEDYFLTNDDGEPRNSAGMPILGQIRSHDLSHVLIIVVRYFGGTKLGISGLVKAYKEASNLALLEAEFCSIIVKTRIHFKIVFDQFNAVMQILSQLNLKPEISYGNHEIEYILSEEEGKINLLKSKLEELNINTDS